MSESYEKKPKSWLINTNIRNKYHGHLLIEDAFKMTHGPNKQVKVLDLGCGTGSLATFLRPYAATLIGVDISPLMLFKAEEVSLYDSFYKKDLKTYLIITIR